MKKITLLLFIVFISFQANAKNEAWLLKIDGAIGPATADYVKRSLADAQSSGVRLIILQMDTPGGLDISMRDIVQSIIASSIPVVTYVSPSGARAASAGTYILYASHIAAMAPGTNLGAATPVQIAATTKPESNTMKNKMVNDAEAYLLSLAQMHGRNPNWAMEAVRDSASLPAQEALKKNVIDLIAVNQKQLLAKINAKSVKLLGQDHRILTDGIKITVLEPDWRNKLLTIISNPNVAYILLLLGIYGIFFELYSPGSILPGVVGGISILLALFAFQILPVNFSGIALILLGITFLIAEAFVPSFGALGIGGLVAFIIGSVILIDTEVQDYTISRPLIGGLSIVTVAFFLWVLKVFIKIRTKQALGGHEEMIGEEGKCLSNDDGNLRVFVHSEAWKAQASVPIEPGQRVRVIEVQGLLLKVEPVEG
ncbi:nodulation protein NfeD [Candidatus Halobeggiatoa sp. HSG11]|nr:nodulation protein NfeD [Candidatus Halobeggiatoa sp. HSG11]